MTVPPTAPASLPITHLPARTVASDASRTMSGVCANAGAVAVMNAVMKRAVRIETHEAVRRSELICPPRSIGERKRGRQAGGQLYNGRDLLAGMWRLSCI